MSEGDNRDAAVRRRRVQRLKKMIILMLLSWGLTPCMLCVILFVRVGQLESLVNTLEVRLEELAGICSRQEEELQKISSLLQEEGGGSAIINGAVPDAVLQESVTGAGGAQAGEEGEEPFQRKVYLTFDDGPSIYTDEILDILARYDVKATFFVLKKEDDASKAALRRIAEEGHTLGMHSCTHKYSEIYASVDAFAEDLSQIQDYLYEVTGVESNIYRFPGGSSNKVSRVDMREFIEYLDSQGVEYYDWNMSAGDASRQALSVEAVVANCTSGLEKWDTAMILMHDAASRKSTVEALPIIIENILAMEDTVILPITEDTVPVQHIQTKTNE